MNTILTAIDWLISVAYGSFAALAGFAILLYAVGLAAKIISLVARLTIWLLSPVTGIFDALHKDYN